MSARTFFREPLPAAGSRDEGKCSVRPGAAMETWTADRRYPVIRVCSVRGANAGGTAEGEPFVLRSRRKGVFLRPSRYPKNSKEPSEYEKRIGTDPG